MKIGAIIDERYEILKEIGRGGMSVVYLAMDNRLKKSLAIKEIQRGRHRDHELLLNSLIVEANMLKKLDHGALPKIYDIIESSGDIYVVMDYVEGESLKQKLVREDVIQPEMVIDWAKQLSDVLGYLHTRKPHPIIYRDMKPDNIMLTPEGKIKLIDFGISREYKVENQTDTTNLGTKCYAAPEQMAGKQTDARTDIYSLGVTLYHLLTGKTINEPPFELRPIRTWNPLFSEGLEHIVEKCTQAEPLHRYQSCFALSHDLENIHKLNQGYKDILLKKLAWFSLPVGLTISSLFVTGFGYYGIEKETYLDYKGLMNKASQALLKMEDDKAVEFLETAIMKVDGQRSEAYSALLDVYLQNDRADEGLTKIESYLAEEHGKVHRNNDVLFKMGMTYFATKKDYISAYYYFEKVDEKQIPAARYYRSLAQTMGMMNVDYRAFHDELLEFEQFNDEDRDTEQKISNYSTLAGIYLSYKGQLPDANSESIRLVEKAQMVIRRLENEQLEMKYEVEFEQKLAQAYNSRGISNPNKEEGRKDFQQAIHHYLNLLTLEVRNEEEVRMKLAQVYVDMGEVSAAVQQLEETKRKFPTSIAIHVKLGNLLLDIETEKAEEERSYSKVVNIYRSAGSLKGATSDESFKKFTRRLQNLRAI